MPDRSELLFILIQSAISQGLGLEKVEKQLPKVEKHDPTLLYKYKNTTLVQPEVRFGVLPPQETDQKLVNRYVYKYGLRELKEFVKAQYWKLVDFVPGLPGAEKEISYTRETDLTLHSFEEIGSKLGIISSQEIGVDGFKLRNEVSKELSRLTGESFTISEKTSKQRITKIPPQSFEWYFAIYQLIDVYTINTVRYLPVNSHTSYTKAVMSVASKNVGLVPIFVLYHLMASVLSPPIAEVLVTDQDKVEAEIADRVKANLAKRNFESGLKQYSGNSDYAFQSETFEVPTLYFCEKCDPPLK